MHATPNLVRIAHRKALFIEKHLLIFEGKAFDIGPFLVDMGA